MINIFDNFFQDEVLDSSYFYSEKVVIDNSRLNLLCDNFFLRDTLLE